jgi:hypothetical protein
MAKVIIKTAKADDPIYNESITISSSLGAAIMRARAHYQKQPKKAVEISEQKGNCR